MKHLLLTTIAAVLLVTTAFADPIHDAVKNGDLAGVQADGEEPKARLAPVPLREDALLFRQLAIPKPFLTKLRPTGLFSRKDKSPFLEVLPFPLG